MKGSASKAEGSVLKADPCKPENCFCEAGPGFTCSTGGPLTRFTSPLSSGEQGGNVATEHAEQLPQLSGVS